MIPNPKRVNQIQESMLDVWPEGSPEVSMPTCPYNKEDCESCHKNADAPPCIRDIAHLAATYEARQKIAKGVVDKRAQAGKRLKTMRYRVRKLKTGFLKQKRLPKALRSYGKHRHEALMLNNLKDRFTDRKMKVGNRELAKFIFSIDKLFKKKKKLRELFIIMAMEVVEPSRNITEDTIQKTRSRYRHLNKAQSTCNII